MENKRQTRSRSALQRCIGWARNSYYRIDWQDVVIVTVIGACFVALFFLLVAMQGFHGHYRIP